MELINLDALAAFNNFPIFFFCRIEQVMYRYTKSTKRHTQLCTKGHKIWNKMVSFRNSGTSVACKNGLLKEVQILCGNDDCRTVCQALQLTPSLLP
jgi:hypothetical protein